MTHETWAALRAATRANEESWRKGSPARHLRHSHHQPRVTRRIAPRQRTLEHDHELPRPRSAAVARAAQPAALSRPVSATHLKSTLLDCRERMHFVEMQEGGKQRLARPASAPFVGPPWRSPNHKLLFLPPPWHPGDGRVFGPYAYAHSMPRVSPRLMPRSPSRPQSSSSRQLRTAKSAPDPAMMEAAATLRAWADEVAVAELKLADALLRKAEALRSVDAVDKNAQTWRPAAVAPTPAGVGAGRDRPRRWKATISASSTGRSVSSSRAFTCRLEHVQS